MSTYRELAVEPDVRGSRLFSRVRSTYEQLLAPGASLPVWAQELTAHPGGLLAAYTGVRLSDLDSRARSAVHVVDIATERVRQIECSVDGVRCPQWRSASDSILSFVGGSEDRDESTIFYWDDRSRSLTAAHRLQGFVEQMQWAPDGTSALLLVAEAGSDRPSTAGATAIEPANKQRADWLPNTYSSTTARGWRRVWRLCSIDGTLTQVAVSGLTVWEARWVGSAQIAAVVSDRPDEWSWFRSHLVLIDCATGAVRQLYRPRWQLGSLASTGDGREIAFVHAPASDRGVICGELLTLDIASARLQRVDTNGVDVCSAAFRSNGRLCYAGHRCAETVLGEIDRGRARDQWTSSNETIGEYYPTVVPVGTSSFFALVEAYDHPPFLAVIEDQRIDRRLAVVSGQGQTAADVGRFEAVSWTATDGTELYGLLARNQNSNAQPLIVDIHGGPVWLARPRWVARLRACCVLVSLGCSVFYPNPRGSAGRGSSFIERLIGDVGGVDAADILAGVDHLISSGVAAEDRTGLHGVSYGGFMTCWLVAREQRFRAAVAVSPITNWYSQHSTSHIPAFDEIFLAAPFEQPAGAYFNRSPVMFSSSVTTPTLLIAGLRDRCTPATQALEFYQRLNYRGADAGLVVYSQEGHGVRQPVALLDYVTRTTAWFAHYLRLEPPT